MSTERESRAVWTPATTEAARALGSGPDHRGCRDLGPPGGERLPMSAVVAPPNVFPLAIHPSGGPAVPPEGGRRSRSR